MGRMARQTKKTVAVHIILIASSLVTENYAQAFARASPFYPNTYHPSSGAFTSAPLSKGYYQKTGNLGYYYSQPVNAQYWTGHPSHLVHHPALGQRPFPRPYHPQYYPNSYHPQPYYPQSYRMWQHPMAAAYSPHYGQYPPFDAHFWSGKNYHPAFIAPVYPHPVPVYHPPLYQPVYMMPHSYHHTDPYYMRPYDRGFLSGTGHGLAKGLMGVALVGAISKVARGHK